MDINAHYALVRAKERVLKRFNKPTVTPPPIVPVVPEVSTAPIKPKFKSKFRPKRVPVKPVIATPVVTPVVTPLDFPPGFFAPPGRTMEERIACFAEIFGAYNLEDEHDQDASMAEVVAFYKNRE